MKIDEKYDGCVMKKIGFLREWNGVACNGVIKTSRKTWKRKNSLSGHYSNLLKFIINGWSLMNRSLNPALSVKMKMLYLKYVVSDDV